MIVVLSTDAVEMDKVDPRLAGAVGENLAARRVLTSNDSTVYSRSIGKQSAPKRQSAAGLDEIPPAESAHTQSLPVPERRLPGSSQFQTPSAQRPCSTPTLRGVRR